MSPAAIIAGALFAALAAVSVVRIVRLPLRPRPRVLLLTLRFMLLALLLAAFIEPTFVAERLSPPVRTVPVLVDVSNTLPLFSPNSSLLPFLLRLKQWNAAHHADGRAFAFISSRLARLLALDNATPAWSTASFLPADMTDRTLRRATAMVIVRYGNWSRRDTAGRKISRTGASGGTSSGPERCWYIAVSI